MQKIIVIAAAVFLTGTGAGRVRPLLGYLLGRGAVARHPASSPSILSTSTAPDDICLELSRVVSTVITCRPGVIMPALRA